MPRWYLIQHIVIGHQESGMMMQIGESSTQVLASSLTSSTEPLGNEVQINIYCDAAHATCLATQQSTTGILIYLNGAPVMWHSKHQNTVESSTFGSEFVSLKIAMEMNSAMQYKLWMMGVPINGPTNMFGNNKSVVRNVIDPVSMLIKCHNAIAYHKCHEEVAAGATQLTHEPGKENCSDSLTKILVGKNFHKFYCDMMYTY